MFSGAKLLFGPGPNSPILFHMSELLNLQISALLRRVAALEREVVQLRAENTQLKLANDQLKERNLELEVKLAKALKNSSNSSKPPSSDIVKPSKSGTGSRKGGKRRIGGQPGHPKHERDEFPVDAVTKRLDHALDECVCCGGKLVLLKDQTGPVLQQMEIEQAVEVTENRGLMYWCQECQELVTAPIPPEVLAAGLCGSRLTALVAFLKGPCHASFSTTRKFLRDVMGVRVSRGQLAKLIGKASAALEGPYEELLGRLPWEELLHVDETGHKENGKRMYTWVFKAATYALFKIDPRRDSGVLVAVLGKEFNGILGCDYFSAYHKYMRDFGVSLQFCLAHFVRDVKFLVTLPDPVTRAYGERLLDKLRRLFRVIHNRERYRDERTFKLALERARDGVLKTGKAAPQRREAQNLAERFRKNGAEYFEFITTPGIGPTNNLAEQAIRFVVIDRKITQGTRGPRGRKWCERIWTVIATLTAQGRSIFGYLEQAVRAHFNGEKAPSLLFTG